MFLTIVMPSRWKQGHWLHLYISQPKPKGNTSIAGYMAYAEYSFKMYSI